MATEAVSPVESRLEALVDAASFRPLRSAVGDGVLAGSGTVDGAPVFCWAQDGSFRGGSLGTAGGETIARVLALADRAGAPVVGFPESGGARVQEGVAALSAYAALFRAQANARVPLISVVTGCMLKTLDLRTLDRRRCLLQPTARNSRACERSRQPMTSRR